MTVTASPPVAPARTEPEMPDRLKSVLQLVGSVVAPTTLLTALLFYFGWAHAYWFFNYFGFDISLLGLTTQDYLMRSVDALFVPLTVGLCAGLLVLWLRAAAARRRLDRRASPTLRWLVAATGLVLFLIGAAGFLLPAARASYHLAYPLSFGIGSVLLLYAAHLSRSLTLAEVVTVFLLVAVSLFWAATNYAAAVGGTRAQQYEREFGGYPSAVLYSTQPLHLHAPGVPEATCSAEGDGFRYRYSGLRLMIRSGGRYFLLPETWSRRDGVAIVVPESDTVRLQFTYGIPPAGC